MVRIDDDGRVRYAKIVRPERVAGLVAAMRHASTSPAFSPPRLLACEPRQGTTIWSTLRGRSLYDLLGNEDIVPAAHAAGQTLQGLHALPGDGLTPHTVAREREVVRGWLRHLRAYAPREAEELRPALGVVEALLRDLPPLAARPIHRDCYDRQIVACDDGGIGMLDFDTLALGDPALDLANLLVHLELRVLQGICTAERARQASAAVLAGYRPGSDLRARLPAYAAATRLRLACVYSFRPDQAEVARRLMWWVTKRAA